MLNPYLRLMRLHQPTGIWLLLWPCWWGIALASPEKLSLKLLLLFGIGAVVMRSAGCILNDIVDREFDKQVERTRTRPLASGEVTLAQAILLLILLLSIALLIALQMNMLTLILAASSLILVAAYPFMKRITWWPQAFLGLTFNWGALLGWAAVEGKLSLPAILFYAGGVFWTLGYDTIYAHQDTKDDAEIGVKSTALRFGVHSKQWIAGFYSAAIILWCLAGIESGNSALYLAFILVAGVHFCYQLQSVHLENSESCMKIFRSNTILGCIVFAAILTDKLFRLG